MKITIVSHDAALTGAPKIAFDIAWYLTQRHEVTLISKKDGPLSKMPQYQHMKYLVSNTSHELGRISFTTGAAKAENLLASVRPDILYVNSAAASEWCFAGCKMKIPVILHLHEMKNELLSLSRMDIFKFDIANYVDLLITGSKEILNDLGRIEVVPFKKSYNFGVFVDLETVLSRRSEIVPAPQNALGAKIDYHKPVIAMCGTGCVRKGSDIFFELASRLPNLDFLWIGPWAIDEHGAEHNPAYDGYSYHKLENFYTTGMVENPYAHIDKCNVFVLPSMEDPNPLVVIEALVLGKPCICFSSSGGSKQWLDQFGYVLSGRPNVKQLESFLPQLLKDNTERIWLNKSIEKIRSKVDIKLKMKELENLLMEFVEKRI